MFWQNLARAVLSTMVYVVFAVALTIASEYEQSNWPFCIVGAVASYLATDHIMEKIWP